MKKAENPFERITPETIDHYKKCKEAAELPNSSAMVKEDLAYCFFMGHGIQTDITQAVLWYEKAAREGSASAQLQLSRFYFQGTGVDKDMAQSLVWLKKAACQGFPNAIYCIGDYYESGIFGARDVNQAAAWFKLGVQQKHPDALIRLQKLLDIERRNTSTGNSFLHSFHKISEKEALERCGESTLNLMLNRVTLHGLEFHHPTGDANLDRKFALEHYETFVKQTLAKMNAAKDAIDKKKHATETKLSETKEPVKQEPTFYTNLVNRAVQQVNGEAIRKTLVERLKTLRPTLIPNNKLTLTGLKKYRIPVDTLEFSMGDFKTFVERFALQLKTQEESENTDKKILEQVLSELLVHHKTLQQELTKRREAKEVKELEDSLKERLSLAPIMINLLKHCGEIFKKTTKAYEENLHLIYRMKEALEFKLKEISDWRPSRQKSFKRFLAELQEETQFEGEPIENRVLKVKRSYLNAQATFEQMMPLKFEFDGFYKAQCSKLNRAIQTKDRTEIETLKKEFEHRQQRYLDNTLRKLEIELKTLEELQENFTTYFENKLGRKITLDLDVVHEKELEEKNKKADERMDHEDLARKKYQDALDYARRAKKAQWKADKEKRRADFKLKQEEEMNRKKEALNAIQALPQPYHQKRQVEQSLGTRLGNKLDIADVLNEINKLTEEMNVNRGLLTLEDLTGERLALYHLSALLMEARLHIQDRNSICPREEAEQYRNVVYHETQLLQSYPFNDSKQLQEMNDHFKEMIIKLSSYARENQNKQGLEFWETFKKTLGAEYEKIITYPLREQNHFIYLTQIDFFKMLQERINFMQYSENSCVRYYAHQFIMAKLNSAASDCRKQMGKISEELNPSTRMGFLYRHDIQRALRNELPSKRIAEAKTAGEASEIANALHLTSTNTSTEPETIPSSSLSDSQLSKRAWKKLLRFGGTKGSRY